MHVKCKHRTTLCCKLRLHKCPYSRVMTNLARTRKSAIFWDFAKGGPRQNAQKSRPTIGASKTPWRKWHHLLISMHLKCKHRTTFCCKLPLHNCLYSRVMTNLARTPKSAIFWDFAKGGPRQNAQKSRPTIKHQGVFEAPIVGLLFWAVSLGPPVAKSQKMADLGVLAKFVITRLYGHLWSRSLQQNVVLCLHFKCILYRRWCNLRQGVFVAPIVGLFFEEFTLVPPWQNIRKWPI